MTGAGRPAVRWPAALGLVLALAGCGAAPDASLPPSATGPALGPAVPSVAPTAAVPGGTTAAPGRPAAPAAPAPRPTAPLSLAIPDIGVATGPLIPLGLDAAGAMEVPPDASGTGWYVHSPAPGDPGPAVLAAHVDYGGRPGTFARLGDLRPGAAITVRRADGTDVAFVVDRVERYPKTAFPSAAVYGDTAGPELRLITCGGAFDDASGHYVDNVVAYARRV